MKHHTPQRDLPQNSKCIKRPLLHIGLVRLFAFGFGVSKCAPAQDRPPPPPQRHLHFIADSLAVMWGAVLQSPRCGGILGEDLSGRLSLQCHDTWWLLSAQSEVRRREGAVLLQASATRAGCGCICYHQEPVWPGRWGLVIAALFRSMPGWKKEDNYEKGALGRGANCQIPWRVKDVSRNTAENTH